MKINWSHLGLKKKIVSEISSLGSVTLTRQAVVSVTYLLMNNILFEFGGETSVTAYAIVSRMLMFALFPIFGITQGFIPIAGFNYGAKNYDRVREVIKKSILYGTIISVCICLIIITFKTNIVQTSMVF